MLGSGELFRAPVQIFPSIFASILIHIIQIRKRTPHLILLCENRVQLAMFILARFEKSWPHVIWTRHFLECVLRGSSSGTSTGTLDSDVNSSQLTRQADVVNGLSDQGRDCISDTHATFNESIPSESAIEYLEHCPNDFFSFPMMPTFALNQLAEDVGLDPELFILNHDVHEPFQNTEMG